VTGAEMTLADTVKVTKVLVVHAIGILVQTCLGLLDTVTVKLEALIVVGVILTLCHCYTNKQKIQNI